MENSHTVKTCFEGEIVFEGSVTLKKKSGQACMENRLSRHIFMDKKKITKKNGV